MNGHKKREGSYLLSHTVSRAVPSAVRGLTSLFGMGRGVSPALWPPSQKTLWDGGKARGEQARGREIRYKSHPAEAASLSDD